MSPIKIGVSLVPANAWGRNVRALVSNHVWSELRWKFGASLSRPVGNRGGADWSGSSLENDFLVCEICTSQFEKLHLHELWDFDDKQLTQRLVGFKAICEECHNAIHFGRSSMVGLREQALAQLMKINSWTRSQAQVHVTTAFIEWRRRENLKYALDVSLLWENDWVSQKLVHFNWLERPRRVRDRLDALAWSQTLLTLPDVVILDTETTGLIEGPEKNPNAEIIELAIISLNGDVLYNKRFKPIYQIPQHVIEIHHISNASLRNAPRFADEYSKMLDVLAGKIVVAYNSHFDQMILENTCNLHGINPPQDMIWECAMWTFKGYQGSPQFLKLPNSKHSALADCMATLELIKKMANGENIPHPNSRYF